MTRDTINKPHLLFNKRPQRYQFITGSMKAKLYFIAVQPDIEYPMLSPYRLWKFSPQTKPNLIPDSLKLNFVLISEWS